MNLFPFKLNPKKALLKLVPLLFIGLLAFQLEPTPFVYAADATITVDSNQVFQTIDGFGCSSRVFDDPHVFNNFDPATGRAATIVPVDKQDEILDRLYGDLKLTRNRPADDPGLEPQNDNNDPENTDLSNFNFAWKLCDAHINHEKRIMARGVTTYFWSPIVLEGWLYVAPNARDEYVERAMAVVRRWRGQGLEMPYYSVQNEPGNIRPEIMTGEFIRDVIKIMGPKLRAEGFQTKFVITDDLSPNEALARCNIILQDPTARSYIGAVATHLYSASINELIQLKQLADQYNLPLWMTEYAAYGGGGMGWAIRMNDLLSVYGVSAIDYMWGFFGQWVIGEQSSLIRMNHNGSQFTNYTLEDPYYTMGHFSRYIRPGARRIQSSVTGNNALKTSAFIDNSGITVIIINSSTVQTLDVNVVLNNISVSSLQGVRTTDAPGEKWLALPDVSVTNGMFTANGLPPQSITTYYKNTSLNLPPQITQQPQNQIIQEGQNVTFSIQATGTAPLSYQWIKNGNNISGAQNPIITLSPVTLSDNGSLFHCLVSNSIGSVITRDALLTVTVSPVAPSIIVQPQNQTVVEGQIASFSIQVTGTVPLLYQWQRGGSDISGATGVSYATPITTLSDSGAMFRCRITNTIGSVISVNATLTVTPAQNPRFNLTVNNGSGDGNYPVGTRVSISADAVPAGMIFDRWKGDVDAISNINSANSLFTMPFQNSVVTATFRLLVNQEIEPGTIRIIPNPWVAGKNTEQSMRIIGVGDQEVKIYTTRGQLIKSLRPSNGEAVWDLKNEHGQKVGPGVFGFQIGNNKHLEKAVVVR